MRDFKEKLRKRKLEKNILEISKKLDILYNSKEEILWELKKIKSVSTSRLYR